MNFDEFQAAFIKENKKLKIIISLMLIVFGVGTASILMQQRYFLYKGKSIFEERLLAEEICRMGFMTLVEGEPNPHVVSKGIIEIAKKEPFVVTVDKLLQVKSLEVGACKIIFKSERKLLAFKITLEGSDKNPFFYKLNQVDEIPGEKETL